MKRIRGVVGVLGALALCSLFIPRQAAAQITPDELGLDLVTSAQYKRSKPAVVFSPAVPVKRIVLKCKRSDGKSVTLKTGAIRTGRTKKIPIRQGKGIYTYACVLSGKSGKTKIGPFKMDPFEIKVGEPPRFGLAEKDVNEAARTITVRSSEPKGKIELMVYGDDGAVIDDVEQAYEAKPGTPIIVRWKQAAKEVMGHFELKVYDQVGFYSGLESLTFVSIPHDDIIFESGKWEIRKSEMAKLKEPLARIREALAKVKGVLSIKLYVGGYTDTVGSTGDNLVLSRKRARSIATWFKRQGLKAPIYFQGFGESVLFVKTPDNTDEKRNRRAAYVLSKDIPPATRGFPSRKWLPAR